MSWLLRSFFVMGRRSPGQSKAGFVLPTVVMVLLVVILLTTVIVIRSFDRSKNISNYRVNQEVLNAALPALDRAKAKIEALFADPNLPRGTPTDISIEEVLIRRDPVTKKGKYDLDDEIPLELAYDLNGGGGIDAGTSIEDKETSATAWRFPVDTDNNGKFDSFTLYGILFRTPPTDPNGDATRERSPLETRALPMQQGEGSAACAAATGTSASLVGSKGWYKIGSQLKRSVFVYVATVPITDTTAAGIVPAGAASTLYENYKGNKGFSALEYQQDQAKIPLANNAVLYEDDVEIVSGPAFRLNGRVFTNSNLFVTELGNPVVLRQVSSRNSCFYEAVNAKIVIGGNLGYGYTPNVTNTNAVQVDLFQGDGTGNDPTTNKVIEATNASVTESQAEMAYNTEAYERRIDKLVTETIAAGALSSDPSEVQDGVAALMASDSPPASADEARRDQLDRYFRRRTRRVPFKEVPYNPTQTPDQNDPELAGATPQGSGDTLAPPDAWMYPFNPGDGKTGAGYSEMTLKTNGDKLYPSASNFDNRKDNDPEQDIGDRVLVGNNLPALRKDGDEWVGAEIPQDINGFNWDYGGGARQRKTQVELLSDLGDNGRDKFWEQKAAEQPENLLDGVGGLRVVTGAGVYLPTLAAGETLAANASNVVWPDSMPMIPRGATPPPWLANSSFPLDAAGLYRPFLKMRATAVYHFKHEQGKKPIACVSSFYDPTNKETARNLSLLEDVSGAEAGVTARPAGAASNNGITYGSPTRDASDPTLRVLLQYQADLVYPNGRLVNEQLKKALANATPTLAEQAAIDSTICALQIMGFS
ncbi:MAG: hypothetical protein F6K28_19375, partial [Microcoleus sp. SIO2G3]|nr:hypothetical protein [Microcoleus sp. SIO2G3]